MEFTPGVIAGLLVLGLVSGVLAGLLGIGGGVIKAPALMLFFNLASCLFVKGTVFMVMIFTVSTSAYRHFRSGFILPGVARYLIPFTVVGVVTGYLVTRSMPIQAFQGVFGLFLLYVVGVNVWRVTRPKGRPVIKAGDPHDIPTKRALLIGGPMGFIAGVLGIGGGSLAGPSMQVFMRMPLKNAIACSSMAMIPLVALAAGMAIWDGVHGAWGEPFWKGVLGAALMAPGSVAGAYLGALMTKKMPVRPLRVVFAAVLLVVAVQLIHKAWVC